MHTEKEIKTAGDAIEAIKEIAHLQEGLLSVAEINIIDKACDVLETLEINNDKLRETIDDKNTEIENINEEYAEEIGELKDKITEVKKELNETIDELNALESKETLPTATLEDENKNKILKNLHHNISLIQLEDLEYYVKNHVMPKGIIYKEVV